MGREDERRGELEREKRMTGKEREGSCEGLLREERGGNGRDAERRGEK